MQAVDVIHNLYAAFGKGDVPTILGMLAEDVDWEWSAPPDHGIPWLKHRKGRDQVVGFFQDLAGNLDIKAFEILNVMSGKNQVAALLQMDTVVRKNGAPLKMTNIHHFSVNEKGLITQFRHFSDTHSQVLALNGQGR